MGRDREDYVSYRMGADGRFRTKDLPLAALLHYGNIKSVELEMNGERAWWVYGVDADVENTIREYEEGVVEGLNLADYLDSVSAVRGDLYRYLRSRK